MDIISYNRHVVTLPDTEFEKGRQDFATHLERRVQLRLKFLSAFTETKDKLIEAKVVNDIKFYKMFLDFINSERNRNDLHPLMGATASPVPEP